MTVHTFDIHKEVTGLEAQLTNVVQAFVNKTGYVPELHVEVTMSAEQERPRTEVEVEKLDRKRIH